MEEFKIYLAGKCKNMTLEESDSWRKKAKKCLEEALWTKYNIRYDVRVINPNDYYSYFSNNFENSRQIKLFDMSQVETSDLVIVNITDTNESVGTGQETDRAFSHNIPVIGFGDKSNAYPWIVENDCQVIFNTLDECLEFVAKFYLIQN